jgi:hypothetical protein
MKYQVTEIKSYSHSPVLELSRQEAKCVETLMPLAVGDAVVVIYLGEVCIPPGHGQLGIALDEQPTIVKTAAFNAFADRFMDFIAEAQAPVVDAPAVGVAVTPAEVKAP